MGVSPDFTMETLCLLMACARHVRRHVVADCNAMLGLQSPQLMHEAHTETYSSHASKHSHAAHQSHCRCQGSAVGDR